MTDCLRSWGRGSSKRNHLDSTPSNGEKDGSIKCKRGHKEMRGGGEKMVVSCHFLLVGLCQIPFVEAEGNQLLSGQLGPSTWLRPIGSPNPSLLNLGGIIQKSSHQGPHWKVTDTLKTSVDCVRGKPAPGQRVSTDSPMEWTWPCFCALDCLGSCPFSMLSSGFPVNPVSHLISSQWIHFLLELARVGFCCLQFWTLGGKNAASAVNRLHWHPWAGCPDGGLQHKV